ncbi:glycosyltransferase [Bacteroides sp. AN502(2024)]|uniref:glycosyltransferase n=1 Tax=Bacteroides sp. AN502(2024) TaxID=3160599 RepID=UPI003513C0C9
MPDNNRKKRICIIYNFAQHYRESIFKLLDQEFDCSFYFGKNYLDIKKMDYSLLKGDIHEVDTIKFGPIIYRKQIIGLLNKDYDAYIILGESRVASTWLFLFLSRLCPRKKVYAWTHGWYGKEKGVKRFFNKLILKLPNGGNFFYGNYGRQLAIKEGIDDSKQYTIHNSLAYDEQISIRNLLTINPIFKNHFNNENHNLIFVGRLTKIKKLDQILKALKGCSKKGYNFNLTFIGSGEMIEELKQLSKELGLEKNVWFYGACYDECILGNLIYNADLCVSPGNVGLTAIHAMVFGCPVITHNNFSYQMPEFESIKQGITGSFFDYNDITSLSNCIIRWIEGKKNIRHQVRKDCMSEIDNYWTPHFQLETFKKVIYDSIS